MQQQTRAVGHCFTQPHNPAGANFNARLTHFIQRIQALLIRTGGNDIAVKFRRGVEVVVVVVQTRIGQALGLRFVQRAQRHTGFQPQFFHALNHLFQVRHIAFVRVLPRRAHAKPR
ncbi:hypothetical protein SDC9_155427 [bioreactor metagenome]|uniref:Uncharacterized protein n=1 Tax=bioreactor metagenome TaxID=1076179 RepID=A0A645F1R0_9ZZZZ